MNRKIESPFRQLMYVLDTARGIVLNTLFVLFMLMLLFAIVALGALGRDTGVEIWPGSALRVAPVGLLVEEFSGQPVERALNRALGDGIPEVRHRDLLDAIDGGAKDERIAALVLDLDGLMGGGPAMYQELAEAVERFRAAGKKVIAVGDYFEQGPYYVASHADEIVMHPMGLVFVTGYGAFYNYYKEALDHLDVDWNVFHAGQYKSYGEPFTRRNMSEAAKRANAAYLEDLWRIYREGVEAARGLEPGTVDAYVKSIGAETSGDFAQHALEYGLVDALAQPDEVEHHIAELVGGGNGEVLDYRYVDFEPYVQQLHAARMLRSGGKAKVAVLVAEGTIVEGEQPPGVIGSDSLVRQIRHLRDDASVRAVVVRVNSGGGSAFASEVIRRELEQLQAAGKPVVVSMGAVAASGGYWMSMNADEIWAQPTTITGSIGVVAMFPTFERTLDRIGVHTDGVGTTPLAGQFRLDRTLGEDARRALQSSVDHLYGVFVDKVSAARGLEPEFTREIAQGRVWSGTDALEHGLVDSLGGIRQAVEAAARLAGVDQYGVFYLEPELSFFDRLMIDLFQSVAPRFAAGTTRHASVMKLPLVRQLAVELERLQLFNDPRGVYALCLCEPF